MIEIPEQGLERLRQVARHIVEHPEKFAMDVFDAREPCGTVACLAGRLCILADEQAEGDQGGTALRLLGVENTDPDFFPLFHTSQWPPEYAGQYLVLGSHDLASYRGYAPGHMESAWAARAKNATLAARLIDEVIERGGVWWADPEEYEG